MIGIEAGSKGSMGVTYPVIRIDRLEDEDIFEVTRSGSEKNLWTVEYASKSSGW